MRWTLYLLLSLVLQVLVWVITPALPLFAVRRLGFSDNASCLSTEPRLPLWLSWLDTPDNSLLGDSRWRAEHSGGYWSMVGWLYRNSLYGFKWTVLAQDVEQVRWVQGDPQISYKQPRFGSLYIRQPNGAWQYKIVRPLFGKVFEGNFGWLLDDTNKQRALFMFSPRIKGIQND